jgi:outer membrane protein, multidrug efflux system
MTPNTPWRAVASTVSLCLVLAEGACSLAPPYQPASAAAPPAFKEMTDAPEEAGGWKAAEPSEGAERGEWWKVFGDPQLNDYEAQALAANQELKAAAARVQEARAQLRVTRAGEFPSLGLGFGPSREQLSDGSLGVVPGQSLDPQTVWRAQAGIAYEVDLFGRVASSVAAARADRDRSGALLRSVQLTLQADVAQRYFNLREADAEIEVFNRTVELRKEALRFTSNRYNAGDVSELDVAQAKAELATAQSDAMTVARERASTEHALAVLLGKAPAELTVATNPLTPVAILIPPGLPSALLERRPDVTAAERAMAAENARIGIARAAYFPSLELTAAGGFESATLGSLFRQSSRTFLLGPLYGTALNLPLFDGGRRAGDLDNAYAHYAESVALYRQRVLVAFQEVEDNLASLRILQDQLLVQDAAVTASTRASDLSRVQYKHGSVAYIEVIDSERTSLQARRRAVQLEGLRAISTVNLIRALGGGWDGSPTSGHTQVTQPESAKARPGINIRRPS